jgi:hypothetical protein
MLYPLCFFRADASLALMRDPTHTIDFIMQILEADVNEPISLILTS